ncbi:MAG: acyl-CoA dehydrogenase family protein [Thermoplasmata archaeon]|nr:acyl-CoA dehydrogenase family protein [Thermoplasmata archaeon]
MIPPPPVPGDPLDREVEEFCARHRLSELNREVDARPRFPRELFQALGTARLLGLTVASSRGGRELPPTRAVRVLFRLAFHGGTMAAKLSLQPEFCSILSTLGASDEQRATYTRVVRGENLVGNQITEPEAGSDLGSLATLANPVEGGYTIGGTKSQAAFATEAESAIVLARTPGSGRHALTAFLVPQKLAGIARSTVQDHGERWMGRGTVVYSSVKLPVESRIGPEGGALPALRDELRRERAFLAAIYLGVAWSSWHEAVEYVGSRETFGNRLADRQAVSFPLVEDRVRLESAWRQTEVVAAALDDGRATDADTAMLKWFAGEVTITAVEHAMQFHGGAGYSNELPHERRLRDLRSARLAHGTAEIAHVIAARALWPAPGEGKRHLGAPRSAEP